MTDRYAAYTRLAFDAPSPKVLRITLQGVGKMNAVDAELHRELAAVWHDVDTDADTNVVLLRGGEDAFSAGGDYELLESIVEDQDTRLRVWREARDLVYGIVNCSRPVVAAVRGAAVGAGLAAALTADITVAARNARLIDGHTRLGVAAGDHAVPLWPLLVGMAKAKYHLLTCRPLSGEEAERIGLVSVCVDDAAVENTALDIATELADGAQTALRLTKHALNSWLRLAGPAFDSSALRTARSMAVRGGSVDTIGVELASRYKQTPPQITGILIEVGFPAIPVVEHLAEQYEPAPVEVERAGSVRAWLRRSRAVAGASRVSSEAKPRRAA